MSTRYVYAVYNTTVAQRQQTTEESLAVTADYGVVNGIVCSAYSASVAFDRSGAPVTLYTAADGDTFVNAIYGYGGSSYDYPKDTSKYPYVILKKFVGANSDIVSECYLLEFSSAISGAFWHGVQNSGTVSIWNNSSSAASNKTDLKPFYKSGGAIAKGTTVISTQSASSKSLAEGPFESGGQWRWRAYRGSDTIDPTAVAYTKAELYAGDTVEIQVSARTPAYGGTVYYQYQYTFDGKTWTNLGSRTTSTIAAVTIPEGAEQFRARVVASDGWGFTSSTYITGPLLTVSQLKAYGTVGGVTRTITKGYCVVDGIVHNLMKGYVTVGGVWKKLF